MLIDGGAVSNLPTFAFPDSKGYAGRFSEKTLAFSLKAMGEPQLNQFENVLDYARGVADTLVASSTSIQRSLQNGIFSIEIDTEGVGATDFLNMTQEIRQSLFDNGYAAMEKFIVDEREIAGRHRSKKKFIGFDERLHAYVHTFTEAQSNIWISDTSTYWLWFIFPALASALQRGVQVCMQAPTPNDSKSLKADEKKRRSLLKSMGCFVSEGSISFTGVLADYPSEHAIAVISSERGSVGTDFDYDTETVHIYTSESDLPVINSIGTALPNKFDKLGSTNSNTHFKIEGMPEEELFEALKKVHQYANSRFEIKDLALDASLRVSQAEVKEFKLLQVARLIEELKKAGIQLFDPCRYLLPDGSKSIITPPVAEMTSQGPVLIEGHTRAFHERQRGKSHLKAIIAHDVEAALPVKPCPFGDLRLSNGTKKATDIMQNYDKKLLRQIEKTLHP